MGGKASNYNVAVNFSNSKDSNVSSESANQPWHEYHGNLWHHKGPICFVIIECQVMVMSIKRVLGEIAPPFI